MVTDLFISRYWLNWFLQYSTDILMGIKLKMVFSLLQDITFIIGFLLRRKEQNQSMILDVNRRDHCI